MKDAEILMHIRRIVTDIEVLGAHEETKPASEQQDMVSQRAFGFEQIVRALNGIVKPQD